MRLRTHLGNQHASEETGIDLAPMLDFVMNLLIFFIITAVFVKEVGITVSRPNSANAEKKEAGSIVVAIRPDGEIISTATWSTSVQCVRTSSGCMRSGLRTQWWSLRTRVRTPVFSST